MQDGFGIGRGLGLGRIHVYAKNDLFILGAFEAKLICSKRTKKKKRKKRFFPFKLFFFLVCTPHPP